MNDKNKRCVNHIRFSRLSALDLSVRETRPLTRKNSREKRTDVAKMTRHKLIRSTREVREFFEEPFIMYFRETRNGGGQIELRLFGIEEEILFDRPWWRKVFWYRRAFESRKMYISMMEIVVAVYDVSVVLKLERTNRSGLCQKLVNEPICLGLPKTNPLYSVVISHGELILSALKILFSKKFMYD